MIQRQAKAIKDIEARYSPKKWAAVTGGALSTATGAAMFFMPALAAVTGMNAPLTTALAALGGGGIAYIKELAGQTVEKRKSRKAMLGLLATAYRTAK